MPYIDIETTTMIKFGDTATNLQTAISGEYEERVRKQIQEYGLQDVVIMNNPTDHIMDEYLKSSI